MFVTERSGEIVVNLETGYDGDRGRPVLRFTVEDIDSTPLFSVRALLNHYPGSRDKIIEACRGFFGQVPEPWSEMLVRSFEKAGISV